MGQVELFGFIIYDLVKWPVILTWAFPEFYGITIISFKEMSNFLGDGSCLGLIRMNGWVENFFCSMDGVGDYNDSFDIEKLNYLVYSISNSE